LDLRETCEAGGTRRGEPEPAAVSDQREPACKDAGAGSGERTEAGRGRKRALDGHAPTSGRDRRRFARRRARAQKGGAADQAHAAFAANVAFPSNGPERLQLLPRTLSAMQYPPRRAMMTARAGGIRGSILSKSTVSIPAYEP
jgi:hypothetical protein